MRRFSTMAVIVAALILGGSGSTAPMSAPTSLQVNRHSATLKTQKGEVKFTIQFNRDPDFLDADSVGRQADAFQYFVYPNAVGAGSVACSFDTIIRGGEIYTGGRIAIRNACPPSNDPMSGGWGSTRALVPFALHGRKLTFSVALNDLTNHPDEPSLEYLLQTYQYGAETQSVSDFITSRRCPTHGRCGRG